MQSHPSDGGSAVGAPRIAAPLPSPMSTPHPSPPTPHPSHLHILYTVYGLYCTTFMDWVMKTGRSHERKNKVYTLLQWTLNSITAQREPFVPRNRQVDIRQGARQAEAVYQICRYAHQREGIKSEIFVLFSLNNCFAQKRKVAKRTYSCEIFSSFASKFSFCSKFLATFSLQREKGKNVNNIFALEHFD